MVRAADLRSTVLGSIPVASMIKRALFQYVMCICIFFVEMSVYQAPSCSSLLYHEYTNVKKTYLVNSSARQCTVSSNTHKRHREIETRPHFRKSLLFTCSKISQKRLVVSYKVSLINHTACMSHECDTKKCAYRIFPWEKCTLSLTSVSAVPVALAASSVRVLELVVVHSEVVVFSPRASALWVGKMKKKFH